MNDFRILPEVTMDVVEAANRYDEQGHAGLGNRFLAIFYSWISHLQENGQIYRFIYFDFRKILLKPFPYALYYRYHGDLLVISLVIHGARNPARIRSLLRERKNKI